MAWAVTIANFQLLAYRKKQVRDRLVFSDKTLELIDDNREREESSLHHEHLRHCLELLAESGRDLLAQRYDENLSIQQISSALDKTANTVRLKLHRLRIELMNCVERRVKKELDSLLAKVVEDELSATERGRLDEMLLANPNTREIYRQYVDVHCSLQEHLALPDFSAMNQAIEAVSEPAGKKTSRPSFSFVWQ